MHRKYKYLSESVLLEETGLPNINVAIIVVVTFFVLLFITWSNFIIMEDTLNLTGTVVESGDAVYLYSKLTTSEVINVDRYADVYVNIPGITGRTALTGKVNEVVKTPQYDAEGKVYYLAKVELISISAEMKSQLIEGLSARMEVVTGSRTMLEYLLGNLYETGKDTFNIK